MYRESLFIYIYLFNHSFNGGYVDSVIHPFNPLPLSTFGLQMLNKKLSISKNGLFHLLFLITVCAERLGNNPM
jgi:hypothetical protein